MKKIVYVDPQSYRNLSFYDYSLLKGMVKSKIFYCCNEQYDAPRLDNVHFLPIFTYRQNMSPIAKIISYLKSLIRLVCILKSEKPDVLHIQWWRQWHVDYFFLSIYKKYARRIVFTAHNLIPHDSGENMRSKCAKYYNKVDNIIVHDNTTRTELINGFGVDSNKVTVIAHGILDFNVKEHEVKAIMTNITEKYQLMNKLVFATMGGQSQYKGTDLVRDAFLSSDLLKNNSKVFLIVAGKGNIVTQQFANMCTNVLVADYSLSDSHFQAIMRLTDVMLLPYRKISQSGVLLTAIHNQIPFAVTPVGGLTDPLEVAPVGWIIEAPTVECVREAMENLVQDSLLTKSIKHNQHNWDLVKSKYNWGNISALTEELYSL